MQRGVFYNPAGKHYPDRPGATVVCDVCLEAPLPCCMGLDAELDFCMSCAEKLTRRDIKPEASVASAPTTFEELRAAGCMLTRPVARNSAHIGNTMFE